MMKFLCWENGVLQYADATVASPGGRIGFGPACATALGTDVVCDIPAGRVDELSESVIGLMLPKISVQQVQEQLIVAGMPNIQVASLGGNQVIISSPIRGLIKDSLLERRDWWLSWFLGFTRWSVDSQQPGRCVWLRVTDAPVHLWCRQVFESVGLRFGQVLEVEVSDLNFEFARVKVLLSDVFPVAAPITLVAEGRRSVVFVREDWVLEESLRTVFPVTGGSGVGGGFLAGEEGISDVEGRAEDVGDSSFSSAGTDVWYGENTSEVKCGLVEGDNTLDKNILLEKISPPKLSCQQNPLPNPSFLVKSAHGEDEDSDRRRKVSLEKEDWGPACNKVLAFGEATSDFPSTPIASACNQCCEEEVGQVGSTRAGLMGKSTADAGGASLGSVGPSKTPSTSLELINRFGTPQAVSTPLLHCPASRLILAPIQPVSSPLCCFNRWLVDKC
jgi:hypothetical protein